MMYKLPLKDLDRFFAGIARDEKLYLPVDTENGGAVYQPWSEGVKMSNATNTLRSAKDFFFPQIQPLVRFRRSGKQIEIIDDRKESEDFVIFGVRACDARSFEVLDHVFLADPVDTYYENRRKHGTVVTLACTHPEETCFCSSFGIDPAAPAGDAQAWIIDEDLYLEPLTGKGEALAKKLNDVLAESDDTAVKEQQGYIRITMKNLPLSNLRPADNREKEMELFNSPVWDELSSHCLGCGTCTFVCPTCQCFDIEEFSGNKTIERYRCWDSCMYNDFTMMAAGTPRKTQKERFRQRFMHKLVYHPINHDGEFGCVGCGRCLKKCPIHMNIVKVMKALEEEG